MIWSSVTDNGSYTVLTGTDGSVLTFATGTTSHIRRIPDPAAGWAGGQAPHLAIACFLGIDG